MIEAIEKALVARLAVTLPNLAVEEFPEKPEQYRLTHPTGAVLAVFKGSRFSEPQTLGAIVQRRRMEFDLTIQLRNLRGHAGAYAALAAIQKSLTGWRSPQGAEFFPVSEDFQDRDNGVWSYSAVYAFYIPAVAATSDEFEELNNAVLASRINLDGAF